MPISSQYQEHDQDQAISPLWSQPYRSRHRAQEQAPVDSQHNQLTQEISSIFAPRICVESGLVIQERRLNASKISQD